MKEWQFDVLFFVALIGAIFLPFTPAFHIQVSAPGLAGYGAILTFVLTQREKWTSNDKDRGKHKDD